MTIRILDEAEQDLLDGFHFYHAQQVGLGDYFLDSLFSDIDSLQLSAGMHEIHFGHHRLLSKRFPFAIYYLVTGKTTVDVLAVLDCRQHPAGLEDRLA